MTTTAPERIWLQIDPSGDPNDRSEPCPDLADVELTWCSTQVGGQEVEYVRADLVGALSHAEGEAVPDNVLDVLDNLVHDNYERSYRGAQNRQDDAELIRCALRRSHPAPQIVVTALPSDVAAEGYDWLQIAAGEVPVDDAPEVLRAIAKHMLSAAPVQVVVPEGWKLVPVEPTAEMLELAVPVGMSLEDAGPEENEARRRTAESVAQIHRKQVARTYKTMLAAAPAAPAQPDIMDEPAEPGDFEAMQRGHEADLYDDVTSEQAGNLVALVRRLAYALRKVTPDSELSAWATGYLNRIGFADSPLRAAQQPVSDPDGLDDRVLMPRRLTAENGVKGTPLEWSATLLDGNSINYEAAEKAVAELGPGWRLPTRQELESLLDLSRHDPAIDVGQFPDTRSAWYWTSTPCAWNEDARWIVNFGVGLVNGNRRSFRACVRAVRAGGDA